MTRACSYCLSHKGKDLFTVTSQVWLMCILTTCIFTTNLPLVISSGSFMHSNHIATAGYKYRLSQLKVYTTMINCVKTTSALLLGKDVGKACLFSCEGMQVPLSQNTALVSILYQ